MMSMLALFASQPIVSSLFTSLLLIIFSLFVSEFPFFPLFLCHPPFLSSLAALAEAAASAVEIGHPTVAFVVRCSFCQIYQENVFDLLVKSDAAAHASSGLRCACARGRREDCKHLPR
jgi:hypothetical protein